MRKLIQFFFVLGANLVAATATADDVDVDDATATASILLAYHKKENQDENAMKEAQTGQVRALLSIEFPIKHNINNNSNKW